MLGHEHAHAVPSPPSPSISIRSPNILENDRLICPLTMVSVSAVIESSLSHVTNRVRFLSRLESPPWSTYINHPASAIPSGVNNSGRHQAKVVPRIAPPKWVLTLLRNRPQHDFFFFFIRVLPQVLPFRYKSRRAYSRMRPADKSYAVTRKQYYITYWLTVLMAAGARGETAAFSCVGWVVWWGLQLSWANVPEIPSSLPAGNRSILGICWFFGYGAEKTRRSTYRTTDLVMTMLTVGSAARTGDRQGPKRSISRNCVLCDEAEWGDATGDLEASSALRRRGTHLYKAAGRPAAAHS